MKTFSYTITDEVGIHARPAGLLAKKAKEFESVCTIEKGGKSVNITKLFLRKHFNYYMSAGRSKPSSRRDVSAACSQGRPICWKQREK